MGTRHGFLTVVILALAACGTPTWDPSQATREPLISNIVAFMGDSITGDWRFPAAPNFTTLNLGVAGNTTAQMLARFQAQVIDANPPVGIVVIDGGINDWLHNDGTPVTVANVSEMAQLASTSGIRVIVASVMLGDFLPGGVIIQPTSADVEAFNTQLIEVCELNGYTYADYFHAMLLSDGTEDFSLYVDGVHPNDAGYAKMWAVIEPLIEKNLN